MNALWNYNIQLDYSDWGCQAVRRKTLVGRKCVPELWEKTEVDRLAAKKVEEAKKVLEQIAKTKTGVILFRALQATKRTITVSGKTLGGQAEAEAKDIQGATPKGKEALRCTPGLTGKPTPRKTIGTGSGSDAVAYFTPGISDCSGTSCPISERGDEMLFHELVHVLRMAAGKYHCKPMPSKQKKQYTSEEEFYAVLITNIYMSEKGEKKLRCCHPSTSEMTAAERKTFVKTYRPLLRKLQQQHPTLFREIGKVKPKTGFNPIREYLLATKQPELMMK
jgi:hypothetical protein